MKRNYLIILMSVLVTMACQNNLSAQTTNYQLVGNENKESAIALDIEKELKNTKFDEVWEDEMMSDFYENFVFAKSNEKVGVINSISGEVVVPIIYDKLDFDRTRDEWLLALKDGKWGCIDFEGYTVLSFKYDELSSNALFDEWQFCIDGKWGLVEPGDKIIVPAEYDDIGIFKNDLAPVKHDEKWGFINRDNELVVPYKYDSVMQDTWGITYEDEVAFVERDGEHFWIDKNGNENPHDEN